MPTVDQMADIFSHAQEENLEQYADVLNAAMDEFGIDTPKRQAMFLAQCAHESGNFSRIVENLNYSTAERLRAIFSVFHTVNAQEYVHRPEKLANLVYAHKNGNGDVHSGDGWAYRGRGLIQVTGRANYTALCTALGKDIVDDPSYLETPEGAARSAVCWWTQHGLNACADEDDIKACTRKINGPRMVGLAERTELWEKALNALVV